MEQGKAYQQAVQTALIASLANGYYNLLMLDSQWDITRETLTTWEETLRTLRLQKETGLATEAAVAQAAANKLAAEALTLQQQITTAENACCTLLGQVPARIPRTSLSRQPSPRPLLAGKPLQLLSRRPDVRQAEAALAQGQTAGKRLERDAEQIAQLQKAVASSRLLMEHSGTGSYLEVLTAQQSLLQAQLTEVSDKVAQLQAVVKLYQALGGGTE